MSALGFCPPDKGGSEQRERGVDFYGIKNLTPRSPSAHSPLNRGAARASQ
jgi:hypothetical protein